MVCGVARVGRIPTSGVNPFWGEKRNFIWSKTDIDSLTLFAWYFFIKGNDRSLAPPPDRRHWPPVEC